MATATPEPIQSRDNPRIKAAKRLQQRRERLAQGRFLVEGARLVADAWQAGIRPQVVFYDPAGLTAASPAHALLAEMQRAGIACVPCTPQVIAELTETVTPQGIAAVLPLPERPLPPRVTFALLLDGVRDPGNAGTLLRSAEAAGVELVLFGPQTVDPFNGKVVRAGMGAHLRVPLREAASWAEVHALLPEGLPLYLAEMDAPLDYDQVDWRRPAALVVGGEAAGASAAARAAATPIRIPMLGKVESLNAAMAGSVVLFEAARQRRAARQTGSAAKTATI